MFDYIEKLRQKSDGTKKKIAFLTSFFISGFIFVIWLTVIYPDFSFKEKQKQTASANETGLFSSFVDNISEGIVGIKTQINNAKNAATSIGTSTHYVVPDTQKSVGSTVAYPAPESTTSQEMDPSL